MLPANLNAASFAHYPPQARSIAIGNLALLQSLPAVFAALLLREVESYDWRFPAERRMLDDQFAFLLSLSKEQRDQALHDFAAVKLPQSLEEMDWVVAPQQFLDALTAYLWSSRQIEMFQQAASRYIAAWRKAVPEAAPAIPRLCAIVLDKSLYNEDARLFRKLRPYGVHFPRVDSTDAWESALQFVTSRAADHPLPYGHWYIDGGSPDTLSGSALTRVSWVELEPLRKAVLERVRKVVESGHGGPEELQTLLSQIGPGDLGFAPGNLDEIVTRFQVSILTQGAGAQVFSTTFVQWAAREALRRAQPCTLLIRFRPRQRQRPMNELIAGKDDGQMLDPSGSLIDADMGAFYTWINQRRLTGADRASLIVWSEGHNEAVAIGPGMPKSTSSASVPTMKQVLSYLA